MFFWKKKAEAISDDSFKKVTESLYKQNQELAVKNKTLSLLRKLYQITLLAIEPEPIAEKITKTVRESLEFEFASVLVFNKEMTKLSSIALSMSERLSTLESNLNFSFTCEIDKITSNKFFGPILKNKSLNHVAGVGDIWESFLSKDIIGNIIDRANIKTSVGYPLIIGDKFMGVLVFCLNREYKNLIQYEQESIASFVDVIAVALDKAFLYKELNITNKNLALANEQQIGLIYFITHQVKGFLTKSRFIFSEMVGGDYGKISKKIEDLAVEGLDSGTKGVTMVQDILNASNIKTGKVKYDMQIFDLKELLYEIVVGQKKRIKTKNLKLNIEMSDNVEFKFKGDRSQIIHVFSNIIDNSVRYTSKGSIDVSLAKIAGDKILFLVKDTGVGLIQEDMKKLFTEGGKGNESLKTNVDSTGYGLFIVKGIVDAHKGHVWAESEGKDKGSQFYVELPGEK